jgi:hypothetical protein
MAAVRLRVLLQQLSAAREIPFDFAQGRLSLRLKDGSFGMTAHDVE